MEPSEILALTAEVATGFAGFGGLIGTLQLSSRTGRSEAVGLQILITIASLVSIRGSAFAARAPYVVATATLIASTGNRERHAARLEAS